MRRSILSPVSCQMYVECFNNSYMKGGGGGEIKSTPLKSFHDNFR